MFRTTEFALAKIIKNECQQIEIAGEKYWVVGSLDSENRPHGHCELYQDDRGFELVQEGEYENGRLVNGVVYRAINQIAVKIESQLVFGNEGSLTKAPLCYEGQVKESLPHGYGVILQDDKPVARGYFEKGVLVTGEYFLPVKLKESIHLYVTRDIRTVPLKKYFQGVVLDGQPIEGRVFDFDERNNKIEAFEGVMFFGREDGVIRDLPDKKTLSQEDILKYQEVMSRFQIAK